MPPQADTLEGRVEQLEQLIARIIAKAGTHPLGRKALDYLGLR